MEEKREVPYVVHEGMLARAEEFNLSVRQIKNIVYKAENRLFKHMPIP